MTRISKLGRRDFIRLGGIASGGLAALMVLGIATRIRVRDPLVQSIPALVLAVVNVFILIRALDLGARA